MAMFGIEFHRWWHPIDSLAILRALPSGESQRKITIKNSLCFTSSRWAARSDCRQCQPFHQPDTLAKHLFSAQPKGWLWKSVVRHIVELFKRKPFVYTLQNVVWTPFMILWWFSVASIVSIRVTVIRWHSLDALFSPADSFRSFNTHSNLFKKTLSYSLWVTVCEVLLTVEVQQLRACTIYFILIIVCAVLYSSLYERCIGAKWFSWHSPVLHFRSIFGKITSFQLPVAENLLKNALNYRTQTSCCTLF